MKIIKTTVIHGPNHWSPNQNKLIVLKLQLENQDLASTPDSILTALNKNSFFFENYTDKNFELLELLKYIATELQSQAGIKCSYINTKKADEKNQHYLIFSYTLEQTGTYTGRATIRIINSLIKNESYNIMYDIEELEYIKSDFSIGATTTYILEEVKKRNIPFRQFNDGSLTTLGYGCKQKKIRTAVTDSTSGLGI
ncbi:MAG: cyanophycin synthetase family protein [Bacteroidota bacterium]